MFGSEALGAVAGGEGLDRASRGEGGHCSRVRNAAVRPEGELRVSWGTRGILVDNVRSPLSGDELVG